MERVCTCSTARAIGSKLLYAMTGTKVSNYNDRSWSLRLTHFPSLYSIRLFVMVGDMLEHWTNGVLVATEVCIASAVDYR